MIISSTGMAVNHTPILTYGGDKSLQSIKKKKKLIIHHFPFSYLYLTV